MSSEINDLGRAEIAGADAAKKELPHTVNPYSFPEKFREHNKWVHGWLVAKVEADLGEKLLLEDEPSQ